MRILFIGPLPEPITGQSVACHVLYKFLSAKHYVHLVNLSKGGFRQGVNSVYRVLEVLRIIWNVWRNCAKVDVIYFTVSESSAGNAKDLLVFMVCMPLLSRMAIHLHGGAGMRQIMGVEGGIVRIVNGFFLRRIGAVIVLGDSLRDIYSSYVPAERLYVIPNFAQDELFAHRDQVEKKFRIQSPLRLLFLSNLLPGKGHLELVQAYKSLNKDQQAVFTIDFAGSFEDKLQRDAFLSTIRDVPGLKYHGKVVGQAKLELFKQAHIFCLPTYYPYEGQPISILEAYASGCAVLTTAHSGIGDIFRDGKNGLQVEARSFEAIKSALNTAVGSGAFLLACALRNVQDAEVLYRSNRFNVEIEGVLYRLQAEA